MEETGAELSFYCCPICWLCWYPYFGGQSSYYEERCRAAAERLSRTPLSGKYIWSGFNPVPLSLCQIEGQGRLFTSEYTRISNRNYTYWCHSSLTRNTLASRLRRVLSRCGSTARWGSDSAGRWGTRLLEWRGDQRFSYWGSKGGNSPWPPELRVEENPWGRRVNATRSCDQFAPTTQKSAWTACRFEACVVPREHSMTEAAVPVVDYWRLRPSGLVPGVRKPHDSRYSRTHP